MRGRLNDRWTPTAELLAVDATLVGSTFTLTTGGEGTPSLTIDGTPFVGPDTMPSPMTPAAEPVMSPKV
jgi:hypothetical protein